jgi:hypothetical protein
VQVSGALLIAVVIIWLGMGLFFRIFQDAPMGFHTRPPGSEYEQGVANQIEGQRRFTDRWLRLWPIAVGMVIVATVLIAVG